MFPPFISVGSLACLSSSRSVQVVGMSDSAPKLTEVPNSPTTSSPRRAKVHKDPWPEFEREMDSAVDEVCVAHQRFSAVDGSRRTVMVVNEYSETVSKCDGMLQEATGVLQATIDHPEKFHATSDDIQKRQEKIIAWERRLRFPRQAAKDAELAFKKAQARHDLIHGTNSGGDNSADDRNAGDMGFIRDQEMEQRVIVNNQDQALTRIAVGLTTLKENATEIKTELVAQEGIMADIEKKMMKVGLRLDQTVKKVERLLDQASDTKKILCIVVLAAILLVLIVVLFQT